MNYAALTATVDWFEVLQAGALALALLGVLLDLRAAWRGANWAVDQPTRFMRRLGPVQFFSSLAYLGIILTGVVMTASSMLVPSAIQTQEGTTDVVNALIQRWGGTFTALLVLAIAVGANWVRRYAGAEGPTVSLEHATVVEAPAVIIPPTPPPEAPTPGPDPGPPGTYTRNTAHGGEGPGGR